MKSRVLSLAGDTLTYGIFILIGRFLTFLLTPFYTNYLSVEEVGDVGNFFALIAFVNVIYSFGMDAAFFRFYSKDNLELSRIAFTYSFLSIFAISLVLSLFLFLSTDNMAGYLTNLPDAQSIVKLAILVPLTDCLMVVPYAFLRITRQVWKFSVIRFALIIIAVALNIYFVVVLRIGIKGVFYAQLIANVTGIILFIPIVFKLFLFRWNFQLFKEMFKYGFPTVPATFSGIILQVVDRPILKYLTDSQQVGLYMVNYRLAIPMMLFVAMYDYAWRPFYLSHYQSEDAKDLFARIFKYFVYFSGIIFIGNAFFIEYVIRLPFFGGKFIEPSYWEGLDIIPIVMLGYLFNGFYINFSAGINIQKQTQYLPLAVGIAALTNILFNIILIPILGYRGAAWSTLLAYLASSVIIYYFSQKVYPIKYQWEKIIALLVFTVSLFLIFYFLTINLDLIAKFILRCIGILLFVLAPFVLNVFTNNERRLILYYIKTLFKYKI